ncbi:aspartyl/asparaginyl beta-hydroxylase domain-containing protein [Aureitalea sp. L0-47]|uniref:aspartyl/asparaginyl beta-hydroxylase domain-containing protein n=1 Tax=Aureitalea sp. L0-47 TaxID=2816962 RepID=UPI002237D7DE|nr:aspartyl/asparaginyl beta-hydroxylase domain-containing protein [Aureitalea sp. L0-47]MCW5518301.1 aspartyl/asparaginyl beta-hydroxylase domain-containing protein [Aureitalea sp. L0-47]
MITLLELPFQFDPVRLTRDLIAASSGQWKAHFNTTGYVGDWSVIALYAPGGDASNINAFHTEDGQILPTPLLKDCPYFKEVISRFECPILTARLMKLDAGAVIKPHKDHASGYEDGMFRVHIPIHTNSDVEFILDSERIVMKEGECWYTNVNFEHSVANRGEAARVHLVIDGKRNDWSDKLFFSLAPEEDFIPKKKEYSKEELQQMIECMENLEGSGYEVHIQKLRKQLKDIS